jgi:hypothetical protein
VYDFKSYLGPFNQIEDRENIDRIYIIVVHGTQLGASKGSWWRRVSDDDFPFCRKLSENCEAFGIPFGVWKNCDDLHIDEFEWSGENSHEARLEGGKQLAAYLNSAHRLAQGKYGKKPLFVLIGHSHGGNVILASMGYLDPAVSILSIYFLGTPFLFFIRRHGLLKVSNDTEKTALNLYLTRYPNCPLYAFQAHSDELGRAKIDEVLQLLSVLEYTKHLKIILDKLLPFLLEKPSWHRMQEHTLWHYSWAFVGVDERRRTLSEFGLLGEPVKYPCFRHRVGAFLRYLLARVTWPMRKLFFRASVPVISRMIARGISKKAYGLDPIVFSPESVFVSPQPLSHHHYDVKWVPMNKQTKGVGIQYNVKALASALGGVSWPVHELLRTFQEVINDVSLLHSTYYRSEYIIQQIALKLWEDLCMSGLPRLNFCKEMTLGGTIRIVIEQTDGSEKITEIRRFKPGM